MSKLDLRSFQQEISERLAAARRAGGDAPQLAFMAGGVSYAMPLAEISEVAPLADIRALPGSEPWFLGLTNVRGSVLALSHLGALLHARPATKSQASRVLVLGGKFARLRAGVLVDSVAGLRTIKSVAPSVTVNPVCETQGTDPQGAVWSMLSVASLVSATPFFDVCTRADLAAA